METVRYWWNIQLWPVVCLLMISEEAVEIDRRNWSNWRWHLDAREAYVLASMAKHTTYGSAVDHDYAPEVLGGLHATNTGGYRVSRA